MGQDLDRKELESLLGPEVGERVTRFIDFWADASGDELLPQPGATQRTPSEVRAQFDRAQCIAAELAALLSDPVLVQEMAVSRLLQRKGPLGCIYAGEVDDAACGVAALAPEVQRIQEWAAAARDRVQVRNGAPRNAARSDFLSALSGCLAREGVALSTGENSTLVRVARIAWGRIELGGDPRDTLRRMVTSGELDFAVMAARAAFARGEIGRDEWLALDSVNREFLQEQERARGRNPQPSPGNSPGGDSG